MITPLLDKEKELKGEEAQAPVAEEAKGESEPTPTALRDVESTAKIPTTINDIVDLSYDPKENITAEESKRLKSKLGTLAEIALSNNKKEKWGILAAKGSVTNLHFSIKSLLFDINKLSKTKLTPEQFEDIATKYAESKGNYLHTQKAVESPLSKEQTSEQTPQAFPAQEGAESVADKFQANSELEQIYRDLQKAVKKNLDPKTLEAVKRNPTLVMVEKALRELQKKGIINIEC